MKESINPRCYFRSLSELTSPEGRAFREKFCIDFQKCLYGCQGNDQQCPDYVNPKIVVEGKADLSRFLK
jgi:hypothetical protein